MKKLILITGDLATGKSTLAKKLSQNLKILSFTKDVLKEVLSDVIGFSNRQENKKLSIASVDIMKHIFTQYAFLEQDLILEANFHKEEIENYVRKSGSRVIQRKGATFYAVSMSVCHLCKCILSGVDTTLTVSTMMNGEYGIEDVCLSVLNVVDEKGAHSKVMVPLTDEELEALHSSANVLKDLIKNLDI